MVYKARKINKWIYQAGKKIKGEREEEQRTHKEQGLNVLGGLTWDINSLTTL